MPNSLEVRTNIEKKIWKNSQFRSTPSARIFIPEQREKISRLECTHFHIWHPLLRAKHADNTRPITPACLSTMTSALSRDLSRPFCGDVNCARERHCHGRTRRRTMTMTMTSPLCDRHFLTGQGYGTPAFPRAPRPGNAGGMSSQTRTRNLLVRLLHRGSIKLFSRPPESLSR